MTIAKNLIDLRVWLSDFEYNLPKKLIAQYPLKERDRAKLLILDRTTGKIEHKTFKDIISYLKPSDLLVLNTTKVIPARLFGRRATGGRVEILLIRKEKSWLALARPSRRIHPGEEISFEKGLKGIIGRRRDDGKWEIEFNNDSLIWEIGKPPLPPYIRREAEDIDKEAYQTVYAKEEGSVAAPTAGLHFTRSLLKEIKEKGIDIAHINLHIGPGTFKPIKTERIEEHRMEEEYYEIKGEVFKKIEKARRVVAVGTSVVRALEEASRKRSLKGWAELFIYPGYRFQVVDALITNFHLPASTPLLLVCSFADRELIYKAYKEAIRREYRFLSYGDAMLIL